MNFLFSLRSFRKRAGDDGSGACADEPSSELSSDSMSCELEIHKGGSGACGVDAANQRGSLSSLEEEVEDDDEERDNNNTSSKDTITCNNNNNNKRNFWSKNTSSTTSLTIQPKSSACDTLSSKSTLATVATTTTTSTTSVTSSSVPPTPTPTPIKDTISNSSFVLLGDTDNITQQQTKQLLRSFGDLGFNETAQLKSSVHKKYHPKVNRQRSRSINFVEGDRNAGGDCDDDFQDLHSWSLHSLDYLADFDPSSHEHHHHHRMEHHHNHHHQDDQDSAPPPLPPATCSVFSSPQQPQKQNQRSRSLLWGRRLSENLSLIINPNNNNNSIEMDIKEVQKYCYNNGYNNNNNNNSTILVQEQAEEDDPETIIVEEFKALIWRAQDQCDVFGYFVDAFLLQQEQEQDQRQAQQQVQQEEGDHAGSGCDYGPLELELLDQHRHPLLSKPQQNQQEHQQQQHRHRHSFSSVASSASSSSFRSVPSATFSQWQLLQLQQQQQQSLHYRIHLHQDTLDDPAVHAVFIPAPPPPPVDPQQQQQQQQQTLQFLFQASFGNLLNSAPVVTRSSFCSDATVGSMTAGSCSTYSSGGGGGADWDHRSSRREHKALELLDDKHEFLLTYLLYNQSMQHIAARQKQKQQQERVVQFQHEHHHHHHRLQEEQQQQQEATFVSAIAAVPTPYFSREYIDGSVILLKEFVPVPSTTTPDSPLGFFFPAADVATANNHKLDVSSCSSLPLPSCQPWALHLLQGHVDLSLLEGLTSTLAHLHCLLKKSESENTGAGKQQQHYDSEEDEEEDQVEYENDSFCSGISSGSNDDDEEECYGSGDNTQQHSDNRENQHAKLLQHLYTRRSDFRKILSPTGDLSLLPPSSMSSPLPPVVAGGPTPSTPTTNGSTCCNHTSPTMTTTTTLRSGTRVRQVLHGLGDRQLSVITGAMMNDSHRNDCLVHNEAHLFNVLLVQEVIEEQQHDDDDEDSWYGSEEEEQEDQFESSGPLVQDAAVAVAANDNGMSTKLNHHQQQQHYHHNHNHINDLITSSFHSRSNTRKILTRTSGRMDLFKRDSHHNNSLQHQNPRLIPQQLQENEDVGKQNKSGNNNNNKRGNNDDDPPSYHTSPIDSDDDDERNRHIVGLAYHHSGETDGFDDEDYSDEDYDDENDDSYDEDLEQSINIRFAPLGGRTSGHSCKSKSTATDDSDKNNKYGDESKTTTISRLVLPNWKTAKLGPIGRDLGLPLAWPIACSLYHAQMAQYNVTNESKIDDINETSFHQDELEDQEQEVPRLSFNDCNNNKPTAQSNSALAAEDLLDFVEVFLFLYSNARNELTGKAMNVRVFRNMMAWCGWFLYVEMYLGNEFVDYFTFPNNDDKNDAEETRLAFLESIGVLGLKFMNWGFGSENSAKATAATSASLSVASSGESWASGDINSLSCNLDKLTVEEWEERFMDAIQEEHEILSHTSYTQKYIYEIAEFTSNPHDMSALFETVSSSRSSSDNGLLSSTSSFNSFASHSTSHQIEFHRQSNESASSKLFGANLENSIILATPTTTKTRRSKTNLSTTSHSGDALHISNLGSLANWQDQ